MSCDNREELHTRNSFNLKKVLNTEKILSMEFSSKRFNVLVYEKIRKRKKIYFCMNLLVCMIATCLSKDQEIVLEHDCSSDWMKKHKPNIEI